MHVQHLSIPLIPRHKRCHHNQLARGHEVADASLRRRLCRWDIKFQGRSQRDQKTKYYAENVPHGSIGGFRRGEFPLFGRLNSSAGLRGLMPACLLTELNIVGSTLFRTGLPSGRCLALVFSLITRLYGVLVHIQKIFNLGGQLQSK